MSSAFNIPAGYALVPLEPTDDMLRDMHEALRGTGYRNGKLPAMWAAALRATPPVDAVPGEPVAKLVEALTKTYGYPCYDTDVNGNIVNPRHEWGLNPLVKQAIDLLAASEASCAGSEPVAREPWLLYLSDRADGVKGHFAIARWNPKGYREVWNLRRHEWSSFSDDVLTREQADTLLRQLVVHTAPAAAAEPSELTTCNCRWKGEKLVQQCTLHEAWRDAIRDWSERAKVAERQLPARERAASLVAADHPFRVALQNIASSKPRFEDASKLDGSGGRFRCAHCGFAWQPDSKPFHASDCAYMDAVNALATDRASAGEAQS